MASSSLSKRRGPLRRPKVCHTAPNPGRCHPPPSPLPGRNCSILPETSDVLVGEQAEYDYDGCASTLPHTENVAVHWSALFGSIDPADQDVVNCNGVDNVVYTAPDFPCVDTLTAEGTWSDGGTCTATAQAVVTGEE